MPLYFSPVGNDQTFDANGDPLNAGEIETYLAGSSTPAATYTDDTGSTPQSNPIILNSLGYPTLGAVWLNGGQSYKFIIKDSLGVTLRTIDNISGINDASVSQSEWVVSGFTPTYINATSFSVPGDQTTDLQVNRRLRTTNTSGFITSTITNSVFAAGITTVTVSNDSGTLDAGLSVIEYGLLSATPSAVPALQSLVGLLSIAQGGTGQTTALDAFNALKQAATESLSGVAEIASTAEAQAGTDDATIITPAKLKAAQIQAINTVTLPGNAFVDFTGIPSIAKRLVLTFTGMSSNGTGGPYVQLGDSGGVETSGYVGTTFNLQSGGTTATLNVSAGYVVNTAWGAASVVSGMLVLMKVVNTWVGVLMVGHEGGPVLSGCVGAKATSGTLTTVRFLAGGADNFDAGTATLYWE
jgi:hypothetical protein